MNYKPNNKHMDLLMPLARHLNMQPQKVLDLLLEKAYKQILKESVDK